MNSENLPLSLQQDAQQLLKTEIAALEAALELVEQKTVSFESVLRTELATMLIEVQELTVLFKQQKHEKKTKRLEQKKRGKKHQAPEGLKPISVKVKKESTGDEQKELKRLYREAMLHVHPDKFSMDEGKMDLATEVTTKLIDIYTSGDLASLQSYHAHIFSGNALDGVENIEFIDEKALTQGDYLQKEKERLEEELLVAKARQTYKILVEYDDPMTFLEELREYYGDRISKLRRRTRS